LDTKREWQGVRTPYLRRKENGEISNPQQVQQRLVEEFRLNTEKKPKPIVRVEDEFRLLRTLWGSAEMGVEHERLQVQLALFIQLAGITGNRPDAILSLRYKHVRISLLRDPHKSQRPRPIIELTFERTKSYMGNKDPYVEAEPTNAYLGAH
jgi:integrase